MKNNSHNLHPDTLAIRLQSERTAQKEHSVPLYLTSSFTFDSAEEGAAIFSGESSGNLYSRFSNPNTDEFIQKMCVLEKCESGVATASGMAAVNTALMAHLKTGDHVVAASAIFGNSRYILSEILSGFGVECTFVEVDNNQAWEQAVRPNTKLLFVETPSNPTLKIADLKFLGELCNAHNIIYVVDNCFATPILQTPADFGADLVLHSATKYIDGQGRVLGGCIVGKNQYVKPCYDYIRRTGASLSPFNAWVLSKSLETLSIRVERHCSSAAKVNAFLKSHPEIDFTIFPHDPGHPDYKLANDQMKLGGGLVGSQVKGGKARGARFLNALNMLSLTANLGDTRSIATHPASTTHSKLSSEKQLEVGITPGFIRFSVGLEHPEDIINDINQALNISKK